MIKPFVALAALAFVATPAAARDPIALAVDATDTDHHIFTIHENIPVHSAGPMTLLYPQWETGSHAPTASVAELAGLIITSGSNRLHWRRDPVDTHAFHIDIPPNATSISADFEFLSQPSAALLRPNMVDVQWHRLLLYPAGPAAAAIIVAARLILPPGLHAFTALSVQYADGSTLQFAPSSLEALVDAPLYAARYWRQIDLSPGAKEPVHLDLVADAPASLVATGDDIAKLRILVVQTAKLLGTAPYRHYDAIVSLSDELSPGGGIEHREEGENNLPASFFTDQLHQLLNRDLIAHEYVHAWNGRFRQPADLWSRDFNHPVGGSLLWVYEGQTEFWGRILAARAGLRSHQETLDRLALDAALVANRPGRAWKSLADSTNDAIYMAGHPVAWRDWQRREDYYPEGVLLWLDVDARLRELTGGHKGLDDFAHHFFSVQTPDAAVSLYDFNDVCAALNALAPSGWAKFLQDHLDTDRDEIALAGLSRAGWKLTYASTPSPTFIQDEADAGVTNLDTSIGLQIRQNGMVRSVTWDGPAFKAGLAPGDRVTGVNSQPFNANALEAAIAASVPLHLSAEINGAQRDLQITYSGGLRFPRLERLAGTPDRLTPLLGPH